MNIFKTVEYGDEPLTQEDFINEIVEEGIVIENEESAEQVGEEVIDTQSNEVTDQEVQEQVEQDIKEEKELNDDLVSEYLKKKYGNEFNSIDELVKPKEGSKKLPADLEKYLEYKEETGRSYSDFMETQREWDKEDPNYVLKKYLAEKNPYLDAEEVGEEFEDKFVYDIDYDDEKDVKTKKREFKKTLSEALDYFNNQKNQYAVARFDDSVIPEDYRIAKETIDNMKTQQEQSLKAQTAQTDNFINLTDKLFSSDFKGFDFSVSGNKMNYNVLDVANVKESQKDVSNFFQRFVDENGMLKNAADYHKALHAGMNADKIAEHFYELGKSDAIKADVSNSKNIDMGQSAVSSATGSSTKMFKIL